MIVILLVGRASVPAEPPAARDGRPTNLELFTMVAHEPLALSKPLKVQGFRNVNFEL
jgi:hypothetical protein